MLEPSFTTGLESNPANIPQVVIIGAGPAGMFLAYLLVTNGVSVQVVERHPDFSREFRGEGIQPSVMQALESLGFLEPLIQQGIATPAHQAQIFLDGQAVVALAGSEAGAEDFGLIVYQEGFLNFLHQACSRFPNYRLDFGMTVTDIIRQDGCVQAVKARSKDGQERLYPGGFFVVASGRSTALRKQAGLQAQTLETSFDIYWMKFDAPPESEPLLDGFNAYLQDRSLFIFYRTYDGRIQVAWGKRGWERDALHDMDKLKALMVQEAPAPFKPMIAGQLSATTNRQLLKVACDRLDTWHIPGMLFLGDAAHTMSPVAGQGINLAMRDSLVAANRMLQAQREGRGWDEQLCADIEAERRPEVEAMQAFQVRLGRLMLGAPRWQQKLFFKGLLPVLSVLGIRQRAIRQVQRGLAEVEVPRPGRLTG